MKVDSIAQISLWESLFRNVIIANLSIIEISSETGDMWDHCG